MDIQEGSCPVCLFGQTADRSLTLGSLNHYTVMKCPECGLVYAYPKPTLDQLSKLYSNYHVETNQIELSGKGEVTLFQNVLHYVSSRGAQGELLDIGASYGHFLDMARSKGYSTRGIEIAVEPCEYARRVFHLDVECKTLAKTSFNEDRFSAITLLNVFEHMPDPYETLIECRRITRPDGVIVIVVPNLLFAYPYFSLTRRLGLEIPVPSSAYAVPYHLTLFSPRSLRRILHASGWEDIMIVNAPVILNSSFVKTTAKRTIKWLGDKLADITSGRLVLGYSLLAVAQKPKPRMFTIHYYNMTL